jgi:hypothetical protein
MKEADMPKGKPGVPATITGVTLKLRMKDRLTIVELLPQQAGLVAQILSADIQEKMKVTQGDIRLLNWRPNYQGGIEAKKDKNGNWEAPKDSKGDPIPQVGWRWDDKNDHLRPFHFTESEISFLKGLVDKLDKEEKISREGLGTYKMIKYGQPHEETPAPAEKADGPEVV